MSAVCGESDWVARLRAGEDSAFEDLVRANQARLVAVCRRILGNDEDALDAVQDTFLLAFRGLGAFDGRSRLSTWLYSIAVNSCRMKLRSRRRRPEFLVDWDEDDPGAARVEALSPGGDRDAADALDAATARAIVRAGIDRLPAGHRAILVLRDLEELDTGEAARALGIRPETAKMRLFRARQALRTLLEARTECVAA